MPWNSSKRWPPLTDAQLIERVKSKCKVTESGCWEHQGWKNEWGYAQLSIRNKRWMAHRLMYTLHKGAIPAGMDCLHRCDNPPCCNPDHLWLGTQLENSLDMVAKGRTDAQKRTHCPYGHAYEGDNVLRWGSGKWRTCKTCTRIRNRMKLGWTREQAETLPLTPPGRRPINCNRSA